MPGYVTLILVVTLGIIALIAGVSLAVATFLPGREPSRRIRDWIKACRGLEERPPRRGPSRGGARPADGLGKSPSQRLRSATFRPAERANTFEIMAGQTRSGT